MSEVPAIPGLFRGDNLELMRLLPSDSIDLIYFDPPFFTGKHQSLLDRTFAPHTGNKLSFADVWDSHADYLAWVKARLEQAYRLLKLSGALFLHCNWHATHLLRLLLDEVFGSDMFRSEIIWYYKRWTNTAQNFQHSHQTIFFYSKSDDYKFNLLYEDYSLTTNIDQIWQKRGRDESGKSITLTQADGTYEPLAQAKLGVPMRDVWEIPYLNPRAKERTGWPTQKPLELLQRIILTCTNPDNIVLDPACGSGTALVAAKLLGRQWLGFDVSEQAISISQQRLDKATLSTASANHNTPYQLARFMKLSRAEKLEHLAALLQLNLVRRNANLDGFFKSHIEGGSVAMRYIERGNAAELISQFVQAALKKHSKVGLVVMPHATSIEKEQLERLFSSPLPIVVLNYADISRKNFNLKDLVNAGRQASFNFG